MDEVGDGLQVVDCQPNVHEYVSGHIPGAVYLNENVFRVHEGRVPTRWLRRKTAGSLLGQLGLDPRVPVVVYTGPGVLTGCAAYVGDGLEQTMVAYSLLRYGCRRVRLLDGGLEAWTAAGGETTRVSGKSRPSQFAARLRRDLYVTHREFVKRKDRDDVLVLDARPPETYAGQGVWPKPGHVPGAVNLPWKALTDEGNRTRLRPAEECRAAVAKVGASPDKTIVCMCGTGREATVEFLVLRYLLGFPDVRLYEGSYTEWTSDSENPTVVGPSPR
jgi:thiosulfate/3-mercaptopyruvate sulfurtransferase